MITINFRRHNKDFYVTLKEGEGGITIDHNTKRVTTSNSFSVVRNVSSFNGEMDALHPDLVALYARPDLSINEKKKALELLIVNAYDIADKKYPLP